MLPCLNKKLFGIDCLGCGLQRSVMLLLQGEFQAAFYMYPAVYPLILLLVFMISRFWILLKYDKHIRILLITITVITIIISYLFKMKVIHIHNQ